MKHIFQTGFIFLISQFVDSEKKIFNTYECGSVEITRTYRKASSINSTMKRIKPFWRAASKKPLEIQPYSRCCLWPYAAGRTGPKRGADGAHKPRRQCGNGAEGRVSIIHFIVVQRYHLMNLNVSHCRCRVKLPCVVTTFEVTNRLFRLG